MEEEARFALTDIQKSALIEHLQMGRDPREMYTLLWPSKPPAPYAVFLRSFTDLVIAYLGAAGSKARSAASETEAELLDGLVEMARGLLSAFREALDAEAGDDPLAKFHVLPKLVQAYRAVCAEIRGERRQRIDEAAAMHSLTASNAARETD